jgi:hypothetical protein
MGTKIKFVILLLDVISVRIKWHLQNVKNGSHAWPPRSPDFTSTDLFLWSALRIRFMLPKSHTGVFPGNL